MRRFVQPPRAASTSFVRKRLSGVADAFDEFSGFAIEMEHTTIAEDRMWAQDRFFSAKSQDAGGIHPALHPFAWDA
jgi:hypothetical protein